MNILISVILKPPRSVAQFMEAEHIDKDKDVNLGGASIPSLIVTHLRKQLSTAPQHLIMSSFGLGLSWATMSATLGPMVIPTLQYI